MHSSELITFGLTWLADNNLGVVVLLLTLIPMVAVAALSYAIHALVKLLRRER